MMEAVATFEFNDGLLGLIAAAVERAIASGAELIRDEAKLNCPVATGALQSSIAATPTERDGDQIMAAVYAEADHAGFVEFGTGIVGAGTYPYDLPSAGVPYTGSWIYDFRHQNWIGQAAQPYMRPALDTATPGVIAAIETAVAEVLKS